MNAWMKNARITMNAQITGCVAGCLLMTVLSAAEADIRQEAVRFDHQQSSATLRGRIKGDQNVDYQLPAKSGQTLEVDFKASNLSAYFNVLPQGSEQALFVGSTSGEHFEGQLPGDGVYTIRVYLMRNAARRHEAATYTVKLRLLDSVSPQPSGSP